MVGQVIWRSFSLVLTGGVPSQRRVPRLGSMRSSQFSVIVVWVNSRLNSPLPRCPYRWRRRRFPSFNSPRPAGSRVRKTIIYIVRITVYFLIRIRDHHGYPQ